MRSLKSVVLFVLLFLVIQAYGYNQTYQASYEFIERSPGTFGPNGYPIGFVVIIYNGTGAFYLHDRIAYSVNRDVYEIGDTVNLRFRLEDFWVYDCGWWYVGNTPSYSVGIVFPNASATKLPVSMTATSTGVYDGSYTLKNYDPPGWYIVNFTVASQDSIKYGIPGTGTGSYIQYIEFKVIGKFQFQINAPLGIGNTVINKGDSQAISVTLKDNAGRIYNTSTVGFTTNPTVTALVIRPDGTSDTVPLSDPEKDGTWTGTYTNTNVIGDYIVRVYASDTGKMLKGGENTGFTVIGTFPGYALFPFFSFKFLLALFFITIFSLIVFKKSMKKIVFPLLCVFTFSLLILPVLDADRNSSYTSFVEPGVSCSQNYLCHYPQEHNKSKRWAVGLVNKGVNNFTTPPNSDDWLARLHWLYDKVTENYTAWHDPSQWSNLIPDSNFTWPAPENGTVHPGKGVASYNPTFVHSYHNDFPDFWYKPDTDTITGEDRVDQDTDAHKPNTDSPSAEYPGETTGNWTAKSGWITDPIRYHFSELQYNTIFDDGDEEKYLPGNWEPTDRLSSYYHAVGRLCGYYCHDIIVNGTKKAGAYDATDTHGWKQTPMTDPVTNKKGASIPYCQTCHSGITNASVSHGPTSNTPDCETCHMTDGNNLATVTKLNLSVKPSNCGTGDNNCHGTGATKEVNLVGTHENKHCRECHNNGHNIINGSKVNCTTCHYVNLYGTHSYIDSVYSPSGSLNDTTKKCAVCHYVDSTANNHSIGIPSCSTCHGPDKGAGANENFTYSNVPNWITGESPIHNETGLQCITCHGGTSPHNVTKKPSCKSCHNDTTTNVALYLDLGSQTNKSIGHGNHTYNVTCMQCHNNATFVIIQRADPNGAGNLHNPGTKIFDTNIHATNYTWKIPGYKDLPSGYKYNETDNVTKAIFSCGQCHSVANRTDKTLWIQPHAGNWSQIKDSRGVGCLNCHNGINFNMTPSVEAGLLHTNTGTRLLNTTIHTTNTSEIIPGLNYSITSSYARDSVTWVRAMCRICHDKVDSEPHNPSQSCLTCHTGSGISANRPAYHAIEISKGGGYNCSYCHTVYGKAQGGTGSSLIDETIFGASIHRDINSTIAWDSTNFTAMNYRCWECHLDPWSMTDPDTIRNCTSCHTNSSYTKAIQIYEHYTQGDDIQTGISCYGCHNNSLTNVTGGESVNIGDGVNDPKDNLIWVSHFGNRSTSGVPVGLVDTVNCTNCHLNNTYEIYFGADNRTIERHLNETNCWRCHSNSTVEELLDTGGLANLRSIGLTFHDRSLNISVLNPPVDCTACHSNTTYGLDIVIAPQIKKHNATNCYYCHNNTASYVNLHNLTITRHNETLNISYCADKCHINTSFGWNVLSAPQVPNTHGNSTHNCTNCHFELYNASAPYRTLHNLTIEINCTSCHEQTKNNLNFTSHADNRTFFNLSRAGCENCHEVIHKINVTKPYWCGGCHNTTSASYYGLRPLVVHAKNLSIFGNSDKTLGNCTICHLEIHRNETDMLSYTTDCMTCHNQSATWETLGAPQVNWTLFTRSVHYNTSADFQDLLCTNCHNNKKINSSIHKDNVTIVERGGVKTEMRYLCNLCHEGPHNVTYTSFEQTYNMSEPQRKDSWLNWW